MSITLTGSDLEGTGLTFVVASAPAHGTLSGTAPNLVYTPASNYNGADSFTFTASDGEATSAPATISLWISPLNDPPAAVADSASTPKNTQVVIAVLANDSDPEGNPLTVTATTPPTKGGAVTIVSGGTAIRYKPKPAFTGTDTFTYTVGDGQGGTGTATVTVNVTQH